ncbi:MAG: tetratricopeptide repeat protein [Dehalococcoidia bacterium]
MGLFKKRDQESVSEVGAPEIGWFDKGVAARNERKYEEALDCFAKALEEDSRNANAWYRYAEALALCQRYEESIDSCDRALEIDPSPAATWFLKGFAHQMLGQFAGALQSCDKGLEITPENQVAWCTRGEYLYALGMLEEAMESFSTALKIAPDSDYAGRVKEKIRKWLQREGRNDAWATKILAFLEGSEKHEEKEDYQEALEMNPRSEDRSFKKDFALAHLEKPEQLKAEYEKARAERQPLIRLELSEKEFQFGKESWVEVTLFNDGTGPARDISMDFPPEVKVKHLDVDPDMVTRSQTDNTVDLQLIAKLDPGDQKVRTISLMPVKAGDAPLEVQVSYTDQWGESHRKPNTIWVNVFKAGEQKPRVPGYTVLWRLSSGDTADIYAAKKGNDPATIIMKMPRISAEHTGVVAEFMSEVKLWSGLSHPNIVKVYQYGDDPFPFIAMEYMAGGPLKNRMGNLNIAESLQIGMYLADALYYAGRLMVTHRDINPNNVFFDKAGVAKLGNWRLKSVKPKASESASGSGSSLAYSSPEQVSFDFGGTDSRTDIYQLGVLLYEMFTGKLPFQGDQEALIEKVKAEPPRKPSDVSPEAGKHLDEVVLRCLAKKKEERYQDARALKADLEKVGEIYGAGHGS